MLSINRYILKEILPQFLIAFIVLSTVLVVSQLMRMTDALVTIGVTFENVFLPFLFVILPFLSFTIPMAFLFGTLVGMSRLNADGEYAAMLASGVSLAQIAKPVLQVAFVFYLIAGWCGMYLESWGRRELEYFFMRKAQGEIDNVLRYKVQSGVFLEDFLGFVLYAEKVSEDRSNYTNVLIAPKKGLVDQDFTLLAPRGNISGSVKDGELFLSLEDGMALSSKQDSTQSTVLRFEKAKIDLLSVFKDKIFGNDTIEDDYRAYPPDKFSLYIEKMKLDPKRDEIRYRRARYLYHQRIATPFAIFSFALFALILGIGDSRQTKSLGYAGAIVSIIFVYVFIIGFKWFAENGYMTPPLAAWFPNFLLLLFGLFCLFQKTRLPVSEPIFSWSNMPWKVGL